MASRRRGAPPTLVTRAGRPVAAVVPVDPEALEDWILANAPEFVEGMREADEELRRGETISLETFLAAERRRVRSGPKRPTRPKRGAGK